MAKNQEYDDSYLNTEENLAGVDYDKLDNSGLPAGQWLCVVDLVKGKRIDFKATKDKDGSEKDPAYTCGVAVLKLKCIEGELKGQTKFDDVRLPHPKEPGWAKSRRLSILHALGVIKKGDHEAAKKVHWKHDVEGRKTLLTIDPAKPYEDKDGVKKPGSPRVAMFGGYMPYDGTNPTTQPQDDYADV